MDLESAVVQAALLMRREWLKVRRGNVHPSAAGIAIAAEIALETAVDALLAFMGEGKDGKE
jgi:hypothetical protein